MTAKFLHAKGRLTQRDTNRPSHLIAGTTRSAMPAHSREVNFGHTLGDGCERMSLLVEAPRR